MDASVSQRPRLALSIASHETLSLDLWKGFSNLVSINLHLAESTPNGEPPPLIEYTAANLDWYKLPSRWAFTQGPLAIWDQSGERIEIKHHLLAPSEYLKLNSCQYLRGHRVSSYELDRMCQSLLKTLRSILKPGTSYYLGFKEKTWPMRAVQCDSGFGRLHPDADDCWVDAACTEDQVQFEVVAGTPIPRFQVTLSTCKTSHPDGADPARWILIKMTSIGKRPVKVGMPDPNFELNSTGISQWLHVHDPRKRLVSNSLYYGHEGGEQAWQQDNQVPLGTCPTQLTFHQGTSWTFRCELPSTAWYNDPTVERDLYVRIVADQSGFSTWRYLDDELDHKEAPDQRPNDGRIEFEPVVAGWDEIEEILEHERPLPFFRLPVELRQMIYNDLKFGEGAGLAKIPSP
ncbi:MAG: hypothetical protein Q9168_000648 [Polycauliona sp. 1 TL-2023]